ncbi:metalloendoproteinase 1-like [Bidens hawaiensis]|uniref:metalloendoproteinase 1-like n=1 Tax=Bidens hawaiensis TaxID=980011 RepID=UPI00404B2F8D
MMLKLSFLVSCIFFPFLFFLPVFSHSQYPRLQPNGSLNDSRNQQSFGFLKNIQGCRKGENVKGIRDLKMYLSHFGYLNYQNNPNVTNPKEGHFDDELEAAIKSYQVYYHLNATGTLDEPTVSTMATPRCGFPDKETHQHSEKPFNFVSRYRFFPGKPKWPKGKRHLTYAFGSGFPTRFVPAVARAFGRWATASQYFTFSRAESYPSADLTISFSRGSHGDFPFDGPGGVLAYAYAPTDGRFHYDADDRWVVGAVPYAFDVETVALHEIGHLLGLEHSQIRDAIMWASFNPGVTKGLNFDDIQGIRALYGS